MEVCQSLHPMTFPGVAGLMWTTETCGPRSPLSRVECASLGPHYPSVSATLPGHLVTSRLRSRHAPPPLGSSRSFRGSPWQMFLRGIMRRGPVGLQECVKSKYSTENMANICSHSSLRAQSVFVCSVLLNIKVNFATNENASFQPSDFWAQVGSAVISSLQWEISTCSQKLRCWFDWQEAIAAQSFYQPIRTIQRGDLEAGFKQADHILEGTSVSVRGILLNSADDQVFIID